MAIVNRVSFCVFKFLDYRGKKTDKRIYMRFRYIGIYVMINLLNSDDKACQPMPEWPLVLKTSLSHREPRLTYLLKVIFTVCSHTFPLL